MPAEFDRFWNDLKKHYKRTRYWLPFAKDLQNLIGAPRPFRYFTLCARSMIDVFMLANAGVLDYQPDDGIVTDVRFCESDIEQYPEIVELVGVENAGFYGGLEELVLFTDDIHTEAHASIESIDTALEDEGLDVAIRRKLQFKRTHLRVKTSFPYDFINLDFCGYYYPEPPDVTRINETVQTILQWQTAAAAGPIGGPSVDRFLLSVTCRHDSNFPSDAYERLATIVVTNCSESPAYREYLEGVRSVVDTSSWLNDDPYDFFMSAWPKEIAALVRGHQWNMHIVGYPYYERHTTGGSPYRIACLVSSFDHSSNASDHVAVALHALNQANREFVGEIDRQSTQGQDLLSDLKAIVALRNSQANRKQRPVLPDP